MWISMARKTFLLSKKKAEGRGEIMRWEYKVFDWNEPITKSDETNLQRWLNEMGASGGELVSVIPRVTDQNLSVNLDANFSV